MILDNIPGNRPQAIVQPEVHQRNPDRHGQYYNISQLYPHSNTPEKVGRCLCNAIVALHHTSLA